jgi:hypothetical protein
VLYELLGILGAATGKAVYATLREAVAYAVLLALGDDHRWRHGNWTELDETHTRLQLDGIALLLAHHAASGEPRFHERAVAALEWLLGIAEPLGGDGLWFLHDTLELDLTTARRFYAMRPSTAFGKSHGNTLCLNTQLDTLTALARLGAVTPGSPYHAPFVRGLRAAEHVLAARPSERWFAAITRIRDRALRAQRPSADGQSRDGGGWALVERIARRLLRRSKERWPRLVLPNGYIERDLTAAAFSDFYHVQNVKDLLALERLAPAAWMRPVIDAGVTWLLDQDLAHLVARHRGATSLLAVLGMALGRATGAAGAAPDGAPDAARLRERLEAAARRLDQAGIGLPVDLVTSTLDPADQAGLGAVDPRLIPVGLPGGRLLVINPAAETVDGVTPHGSEVRVRPRLA